MIICVRAKNVKEQAGCFQHPCISGQNPSHTFYPTVDSFDIAEDAGSIGWYQFVTSGDRWNWLHYGDRLWVYFKNSQACCINPYGFESVGLNLDKGDYRPIKDR